MESIAEQLSPQFQSPLEWWYVHGNFKLSDQQSFNFIFSVFRNQFLSGSGLEEGYQVILLITGSLPTQHWQQTLIDPNFFNGIMSKQSVADEVNVDVRSSNYYFSLVEAEGPPKNIILKSSCPEIVDLPFSFRWDLFEFRLGTSEVNFIFRNPEIGLDFSGYCAIDKPLTNVFQGDNIRGNNQGMTYLTKTRLPIAGTFNQRPFEGQAWLDHQWGDYNWLFEKLDHGIINGWNWFRINFDNGLDLIIRMKIETESRTFTDTFAVLFLKEDVSTTKKVDICILKEWFSHKTDCFFPVSMKITIPEMAADLIFTPFPEDQEIPVFGPMRSVWQGAGEVTGSLKGISVKGSARCELAGYAYIHKLKEHFNRLSARIDQSIEAFFPRIPDADNLTTYLGDPYWAHEPAVMEEMISKPVWDLMKRSGKRWRPMFAYYLLKSLGTDPRPYEQAIFTLAELIHTGSLIIDDIQDGSLIRRGDESIHLRYGQDLAITAGNTLYFLPSLLIMDHPVLTSDQKYEILQLMNRNLIKAHFGQSMDLYWSKHYALNGLDPYEDSVILDRIKQIYALKTGSPIQGVAEAVAVISRSNLETRNRCGEFAQSLGVAFQIIDDIHNFSDSDQWGKLPGEDLIEGKVTFVVAFCIKRVSPAERCFLIDFIKSPDQRRDPGKLATGLEIIRNSGSFEPCREMAISMVDQSWKKFSKHLPPSDSKVFLRLLIDYIISPLK